MNRLDLEKVVMASLAEAVPGIELDDLDRKQSFREHLDIDSVDFLNFITALNKQLGIDIPDVDTPKLSSLADAADYLAKRLGNTAP